jgi:flagellar hook-associated protein 1 FlgK
MASTFVGIETALRGLNAAQAELQITGHNITNANTAGYTRQTATLSTSPELQIGPGVLMGTGVNVTGYQRVRDSFLDTQLRAQTMLQGSAQTQEDYLGQIEGAVNEPSTTGLNSLLGAYWQSWQDLSDHPEDPGTRQALVESASSLADGFNSLSTQLSTIKSQTNQDLGLSLAQVNADGKTLQQLNTAIYNAQAVGDTPNDLLDQRDQVLDDLAQYGSLSTTDNGDGTITATLDGVTLTAGKTAYTLSESGGVLSNDMATPETATLTSTQGKLGGLVYLRDTTIPGYQTQLNTVAHTLIVQTNALQAGGTDVNGVTQTGGVGLDGSTGKPFFSGTDASDIAVVVTAPQIAAASAANAPGDNSNALRIAAMADDTTLAPLSGATISGSYSQLVTTIGSDSQSAQRATTNAGVLVDSLTSRRDSVSGVSLDEEMTNLVKFQQGYQAASRALNAIDDMLNKLISGTGRVGL